MARAEHRGGIRAAVVDGRGRSLRLPALSSWLERAAPPRARGTLSVVLVTDARVRALNRRYRRHDAVTDVLSFSYQDDFLPASLRSHPSALIAPPSAMRESYLGDVVIARGVARRQAQSAGHSELTELRILALHGLLHLLGYDHERDDGRMARLEERLRRRAGLRALGLVKRAGGAVRPGEERPGLARGAGGKRGVAAPPSASERGWGPASSERRKQRLR